MKRICSKIVSLAFCSFLLAGNLFSLAINNINFSANSYESRFGDVFSTDWYYDSVYLCQKSGIFIGDNTNRFFPTKTITAQECYAVLTRLHQQYINNNSPLVELDGEVWSAPYLRYCLEQHIVFPAEVSNSTVLTRELFTRFLSRIYDFSSFDKINSIIDIVDYDVATDLGKQILALYQTGIYSGTDVYGCFSPLAELSRAECATIITRLIYPEKRIHIGESISPYKVELKFLQGSNSVYNFDGKYVYLINSFIDGKPLYCVYDLYGRKIIESKNEINRQIGGIFKIDDYAANSTAYYNNLGDLIYRSDKLLDSSFVFLYGKLAIMQNDDSISVVNTQGYEIAHIKNENKYRIVGPVFGNYIPIVPFENQNPDISYWLNFSTKEVKELPFESASALTAKGQNYMVVRTYSEAVGRFLYNAIDTSLDLVFPKLMESMQILKDGTLVAGDTMAYYVLQSEKDLCRYSREQYGIIEQFSLKNRILQRTIDGKTIISNLKTGEIYVSFSDIDTYLVVGRKVTRPRNVNGTTVIDLFDEHGNMEQEEIQTENIWYGDMGQILYRVGNQYFYISG